MKHPLIIASDGKAHGIISTFIRSAKGRSRLAAAMAAPILRNLNYSGFAHKIFRVRQLPQGALPIYNKDIDVASCITDNTKVSSFKHDKLIINSSGKPGKASTLRRIIFPAFETYSNPTIKISDVKKRRFDIIDRATRKAKRQIMAREDANIFRVLDALGKSGNKEE